MSNEDTNVLKRSNDCSVLMKTKKKKTVNF